MSKESHPGTRDMLRVWAYDEDMTLCEQDEDLLLGRREYLPILLPIAADDACPKSEHILSSLDFYLMFTILRGADTSAVDEAIAIAKDSVSARIRAWADLQRRRLAYRAGIGPVDRATALLMGQELLNGISRSSEIAIVAESESEWVVQLSVPPTHRHKEFLHIDKRSGCFKFAR